MRITLGENEKVPSYPFMEGKTPTAKEFNRRQALLWTNGAAPQFNFEQVATVLLEILADDYDKRHSLKKKKVEKSAS